MNTRRHLLAAATLLLLASPILLGASCSGIPEPKNPIPQLDILAELDARAADIQDVRVLAKGDYWDPNNDPPRVVGRPVTILARQPAEVRISVESGFGTVLGSLASNGADFTMLDLQNNVYYAGPATPENLSTLLPLYLPGEDLVRVLHGGFPVTELEPDWRDRAELDWNTDTGHYRLTLPRRDDTTQLVELTHPELGVAAIEIRDADDRSIYRYQAKDFTLRKGIPMPSKSRFELPDKEVDLTLRIESTEFDVGLRDAIFFIPQPPGTEKVLL